MRAYCCICKDLLISANDCFALPCGHLYHGSCISQWFKLKQSCPQCRSSFKSQPFKIFIDDSESDGKDLGVLEHRLEILQNKLRKEEEKNKANEKLITSYEECVIALKRKKGLLKSSVQALKEQVLTLTKQTEACSKLKKDLEILEVQLKSYKSLDLVMRGTTNDVEKLLKSTPITEFGVRQLSTYVSALKYKGEKDRLKITELVKENADLLIELKREKVNCSDALERNSKLLKVITKQQSDFLVKIGSPKVDVKLSNNVKSTKAYVSSQEKSKAPLKKFNLVIDCDLGAKKNEERKEKVQCNLPNTLKNWEELVSSGTLGNLNSRSRFTSKEKSYNRDVFNIAFDGMGGSKKIGLGHPTPKEEFEELIKSKRQKYS